MAVALSIFISRKPHFSQVPPWQLLLASCLEPSSTGLSRLWLASHSATKWRCSIGAKHAWIWLYWLSKVPT
jgi:hypothetical protein